MQEIFNRMPTRDGVSWNSLISGHASCGSVAEAVKVYSLLLRDGPGNLNRITFSTMLVLSSSQGCVNLGRQLHGQIVKFGFELYLFVGSPLEKNVVMYNTLITGLLRCGLIAESECLFSEMPEKDSISWTTMITGLNQNGAGGKALDKFREMRRLKYGSIYPCKRASNIIRTDFIDNIFVVSALVDMYCKCRSIKAAEMVFKRMNRKNVVSWTALLVGYGQNGYSEEAVRIFCDMQRNGVEPDDFTLGSVISSCANLASLEEGAHIEDSQWLFDEMEITDEVSWTALVSGYAQFGKAYETFDLFERMLALGWKPDGVTFIGVLSACSRAGLVEKGHHYFESMVKEHGITPIVDHYTCIIDLLSRAGRLEEAKNFINKMPFRPDAIGWATLLSSCRLHHNMEIGKWAAESLLELEPQNAASYILLSSLYAAKGKWDEVAKLRRGMRDEGARKEPGCSWIKYKNRVHIFSADDQSSPFSDQIYAKLEELNCKMIEEGYEPDMSSVLHDVEESEKMKLPNYHSEKLAIAFGLIFLPPGLPIRAVKNLQLCGDCHNATKYISKITKREILVRDAVRYHLFKDGTCSRGDFW
ncbi:hypothetical protein ACFX2J_020657 [Malus domestica]